MSKQSRKTARRKARQAEAMAAAKRAGLRVERFGAPIDLRFDMLAQPAKQRVVERYGKSGVKRPGGPFPPSHGTT